WNYSSYFKSTPLEEPSTQSKFWQVGFEVPARVYFFNTDSTKEQYMARFEIQNHSHLQDFLVNQLGMQENPEGAIESYGEAPFQAMVIGEELFFLLGKDVEMNAAAQWYQDNYSSWVPVRTLDTLDLRGDFVYND